MAYKTDGSVHHGGIANELDTIKTLNSLGIYADPVEHRGGTQQKADAVAGDRGISIKRKQGAKVGSFDWVNTTKVPTAIASKFEGFKEIVAELRKLDADQRAGEVDDLRDTFNRTSAAAFDTLLTADLTAFLRDTFAKQEGYDIVVTDTKAGKLHHFAAEAHPVLSLLADGYVPTLKEATKEGQTSRTILFSKGAESIDIGLRLRITSNNGISAFLGLSKANKTSSLVLKLQQDRVNQLLEATGARTWAIA
jgi:hypothetical protein